MVYVRYRTTERIVTWELLFFLLNVGECGGKYVEIGQRVFFVRAPLIGLNPVRGSPIRPGDHRSCSVFQITFFVPQQRRCLQIRQSGAIAVARLVIFCAPRSCQHTTSSRRRTRTFVIGLWLMVSAERWIARNVE